METMKQSGLWSSLGTHGFLVVTWWLCISGSGETSNFDFSSKFNLGGQGQSPSKTVGILTNVFCAPGPNLVILAWMGDELCCGQAQNGVNLDFGLIFHLEGQGRLLHITIGAITKLFSTFCPNLGILAWRGPELSPRQASDWHTDWHTHGHMHTHTCRQRQYPKAKTGFWWKWEFLSKHT